MVGFKNQLSIETNNESQTYNVVDETKFPYKLTETECKKNELLLEKALDIRKFEIELYWNRSKYFWTFIGVTFGGFFALQLSGPKNIQLS